MEITKSEKLTSPRNTYPMKKPPGERQPRQIRLVWVANQARRVRTRAMQVMQATIVTTK